MSAERQRPVFDHWRCCFACLALLVSASIVHRDSTLSKNQLDHQVKKRPTEDHHSPLLAPPTLPANRSDRFPSVEERIQLYMGHWYEPPCTARVRHRQDGDELMLQVTNSSISVPSEVGLDYVFHLRPDRIQGCAARERDKSLKHYCQDVRHTILPLLDTLDQVPVLVQFGDAGSLRRFGSVPHLRKYRTSTLSSDMTCPPSAAEGIVWLLDIQYHYGALSSVNEHDVPWSDKKNMAVFRGKLTGHAGGLEDPLQKCMHLLRCRMAFRYANSSLIDARLSDTLDRVPTQIHGVTLVGSHLSIEEQLRYKAIIILEGNDVGSGLKWALLSNSVVMMHAPTVTSYAMEELLEEWVHYVPIKPDLSDVEEKVQWILDNDRHAQSIARRGSLWIRDLMFHADSLTENLEINRQILLRYSTHFREWDGEEAN